MSKPIFNILSSLLVCLLALSPVQAEAARPSGSSAERGLIPAVSTELSTELYTDPSLYENPKPEPYPIKIGLDYGDSAGGRQEIENLSGGGFLIGCYNSSREFEAWEETELSELSLSIISSDGSWRLLSDTLYPERAEAEAAAGPSDTAIAELPGGYGLLSGSFGSMSEAERYIKDNSLNAAPYFDGSGSICLSDTKSGREIYRSPQGRGTLALMPADGSQCRYKEEHYRGGFEFRMHDGSHLNVINYIDLENYVKGVIPYEMSYSWPAEALKAQAVCARTYAVFNRDRFSRYGFDLTADTYSQVYRGTLEANELSDSAVDSTEGLLLFYKGELCEVYYCSSNGGATEDGSNVFGSPAPYLSGKTDPFEAALDFPLKSWEKRKSPEQIKALLSERGYEISDISRIEPVYSDTGNVISLKYYDKNENCLEIQGRSCYTSLGLNSCRFSLSLDGDEYVFSGSGWGHSCGMSQWGASAMASVYGCGYEDILRFYFSGAYTA